MNAPVLTFNHILWALGIASAFVCWPIIGKYSGAPGAWVNTVVIVGSAISGIALAYSGMRGYTPEAKAMWLLLIAGMINGAAVYFYAMKTVDPGVPSVRFIMSVIILMVVVTPIVGYILNGDTLSIRQGAGIGAAILAIYLLAG